MKITILFLCVLVSMGLAMSILKEEPTSSNLLDFRLVVETNVNGDDFIVDELISPDTNKIKLQYTTFNEAYPAFDIVMDFTEGRLYQYLNLTDECYTSEIPKMDLTAYIIDMITNNFEYVGQRGEHLHLFEIKHPEQPGSRTWLYGVFTDFGIFIPARFQSHYSESKIDYAGEFLDTPSEVSVTDATFYYPACDNAKTANLDVEINPGILGAIPNIFQKVSK